MMIRKQLKKWWSAVIVAAISLQPAVAQDSEKAFQGNPFSLFFQLQSRTGAQE